MKHKHANLIIEWANGAQVEFFDELDEVWCPATTPTWSENTKYRVKPREVRDFVEELKFLQTSDDPESAHYQADEVLCGLLSGLGYDVVVEEYNKIGKWYS